MLERVVSYIREYHMFQPGDGVLVGISGGADSVCLLLLLERLQERFSVRLEGVHVHHGIRGAEADRDAAFAEELCRRLEIPYSLCRADVPAEARQKGISLEEAGREARYREFQKICSERRLNKIAVAHHMDDAAETVLMQMLRGSGLRGLSGIPPVRGNIVRPLLCCGRKEIEEWLREQGQPYCTDSTNLEADYTRNQIRLQILPALEKLQPRVKEHLWNTAGLCGELDQELTEEAENFLKKYSSRTEGEMRIPLEPWAGLSISRRRYVLREAVRQFSGSVRDLGGVHVRQLMSLAEGPVGKKLDLPGNAAARRSYGCLVLEEKIRPVPETKRFEAECSVFPYKKGQKMPEKKYTKWFDYDKIKSGAVLRTRQPGDYLQVLSGGGNKKLKEYFIEAKIPREQRDDWPVLADGSHILWVVGRRVSEAYKVTETTRRVLQVVVRECEDGR